MSLQRWVRIDIFVDNATFDQCILRILYSCLHLVHFQEIGKRGFVADTSLDQLSGCPGSEKDKVSHSSTKKSLISNFKQKHCIRLGVPRARNGSNNLMKRQTNYTCKTNCAEPTRRMIDNTMMCAICWDSFKIGEKICWSKNVICR